MLSRGCGERLPLCAGHVLNRSGFGFRHLAPEVTRSEMRVTLGLADRAVPEDLLERVEIAASHYEPGRERVAEVVEAKIFDLRALHGALERIADGPPEEPRLRC